MRKVTEEVFAATGWNTLLTNATALQKFDDCMGELGRAYCVATIVDYCKRNTIEQVLTNGVLGSMGIEIWSIIEPNVNAQAAGDRAWLQEYVKTHPYYQFLKPSTKGWITKRINEIANINKPAIEALAFGDNPEEVRHFWHCVVFRSDLEIQIMEDYLTVPYDSPYKIGNIVRSDGLLYLILDVHENHDSYFYDVVRYGNEWNGRLNEDQISEKVYNRRNEPIFKVYDLLRQGSTGKIRECYGVVGSSYPYMYAFGDDIKIAGEDLEKVDPHDCYQCRICNSYHLTSEEPPHYVDGRKYCPSCARERLTICEHCGDEYDMYRINDPHSFDHHWCQRCVNNATVRCEHCNGRVYRENAYEANDGYYCNEDCAIAHIQNTLFRRYSDKPSPVFYGGLGEGYGIELEVDDGDNESRCAYELCKLEQIYLKHDGSLHRGIEIITHPASVEYHRTEMPYEKILRICAKYGYRSYLPNSCGLHVHASRSLFGSTGIEKEYTIAKVMFFFDKFWDQIVAFTRREGNKLSQWANKPNLAVYSDDNRETCARKVREKRDCSGRYQAVNLQNTNTVEFRVFRGTTNRVTLLASIEFVDALIQYCKSHELADLIGLSWDEWTDGLDKEKYPELVRYLNKKNLYKVGK